MANIPGSTLYRLKHKRLRGQVVRVFATDLSDARRRAAEKVERVLGGEIKASGFRVVS